jgi:hypothetical protein
MTALIPEAAWLLDDFADHLAPEELAEARGVEKAAMLVATEINQSNASKDPAEKVLLLQQAKARLRGLKDYLIGHPQLGLRNLDHVESIIGRLEVEYAAAGYGAALTAVAPRTGAAHPQLQRRLAQRLLGGARLPHLPHQK